MRSSGGTRRGPMYLSRSTLCVKDRIRPRAACARACLLPHLRPRLREAQARARRTPTLGSPSVCKAPSLRASSRRTQPLRRGPPRTPCLPLRGHQLLPARTQVSLSLWRPVCSHASSLLRTPCRKSSATPRTRTLSLPPRRLVLRVARKRSIGLPPGFYPPEVEMQARSAKRARDGLRTCALPRISVAARSSTLGESSKNAIQNTEATTGWDSDATVTTDADAAATTQRPSAPSTQAVVREVIEVSSGEEDNTTAVARKVINVSSGEDEDEVIIRNGPPPSTTHCPLLIARARRGVGDCVPQPPRQDRAPDVIGSEARANDVPAAPAGTLPNANAVHTLSGHLGPGAMYGHPFLPGAVYAQPPLAPHLGMPVAQPYFPYGSQFGFYMLPAPPMYNHMYATTMKDQCAPAPSITPAAGNSSNNSVLAPPPLHLVALPQNTFLMPGAGATPHIAGDPTRRVPANPTPPAAVDAAPGIVDALPRVVISAATPPPVIPGVGTSSQQPASGAPGAVLARNSEVASSPSNAFAK
ncbi:hypothetical protein C8Q73DRAFT_452588 [Cubamyces lactineus]|nr:hypothetical protein C8Q73DRAFT_452588 [Cubamyces lactineus]